MWIVAAFASSLFAGMTAILAKCGIRKTDSDVATFLRTIVVLLFSWLMVFIVNAQNQLFTIDTKALIFLILSGLSTGASWLCYFRALSLTEVNKVTPIDKSSTILSIIIAIAIFGETNNLALKIICICFLTVGTFLMIDLNAAYKKSENKRWLIYAIMSAVFAALTSILAKIGINDINSNLGTAIRTCIVLLMTFVILLIKKKTSLILKTEKKEILFIVLSGLATGASWLCYYYAIKEGNVSIVVPVDKLSILFTIGFSVIFLKEKLKLKAWIGLGIIVVSTIIMAVFA